MATKSLLSEALRSNTHYIPLLEFVLEKGDFGYLTLLNISLTNAADKALKKFDSVPDTLREHLAGVEQDRKALAKMCAVEGGKE